MPKTTVEKNTVTGDDKKEHVYYDAYCLCNDQTGDGFLSEGWPTKKLAQTRLDQHLKEHETGKPAPPHTDLMTASETTQAVDISKALIAAKKRRGTA